MRLLSVAVLVIALCASGCVARSGPPLSSSPSTAATVARETDDWEEITDDDWAVSFAMPEPVEGATVPFPHEDGTPLDGYASTPAPGMLMEVAASAVETPDGGDLTEDDMVDLANSVPHGLGAEGSMVRVLNQDTVDGRFVLDAKITYYLSGDTVVRMERLIGDGDWLYLLSTTGPTKEETAVAEWQAGLVSTFEFD